MTALRAVYSAEWYRLVRSRIAWVALALLAAVSGLRVLAAFVAERTAYATAVQSALAAGRAAPPPPEPGNAYAPFIEGWSAGLTVGTLVLLVHAARGIAADLESGVLRTSVTRSVSRGAVVWGRALLGVPITLAILVVTALAALAAAAALFEFGPVVEYGDVLVAVDEIHRELAVSCLTTTGPMLACWTFGLLVSVLCRTGAGAVAGGLLVYLGFDLFKELLGAGRHWVFASFSPSFADESYVKALAGVAQGFYDQAPTDELLRMNLVLPWPQAALLALLAWGLLQRRAL